jgi:glycosyltransferase involved in cell wall biosynthesis
LTKRILLVSYFSPSRSHAGALRLLDLYSEMRRLNPILYLALVTVDRHGECCVDDLPPLLFDEVHSVAPENFTPKTLCGMAFKSSGFDLIDLQYHQSGALVNACRRLWPTATIVFGPMESQLRAAITRASMGWRHLWRTWRTMLGLLWSAAHEVLYVLRADRVVAVSEADRSVIAFFKREEKLFCVPTCLSPLEFPITETNRSYADQPVVVFLSHFGSETNQEALSWFCREVHPQIRKVIPGYRLKVVGRGLSVTLKNDCSADDINYVGFVEKVQEGLQGAMVGIAPALSGAGMRGKIHQYAALCIPCVASPIACEGLQYKHDESILVADSTHNFAAACISLLQNADLREKVGMRARELCLDQYQWPSQAEEIVAVYGLVVSA